MGAHRSPTVTLSCEKCGRLYHPWHPNGKSRFCSRVCSPQGRQPTLPDAICEQCGVLFRPANAKRKYCSRPCYRASGPTRLTAEGYALTYRPDHPRAYKNGIILQHRVVMEETLGRYLEPHETVHHINGIKHDNRPENLQLRQGKHGGGVTHECLDCGSRNVGTVPL